MKRVQANIVAAAGLLLLAGCGGSGGSSSGGAPPSGAAPSLGLVQNAAVVFYQADGSTVVGTGDTGDDGVVTISTGAYRGPVIVEVLGDDVDAMYFDEAAGAFVGFPAGNSLHALVPAAGSTVGVTPLTEIAYQAAVAQGLLPISGQAVNQVNEIVRAALTPGLTSLLSVPARFDGDTAAGDLRDDEAGRYALVLAALATLNAGEMRPALATSTALVADLVDGDIDGQSDGSPVSNAVWGSDFVNAMRAALGNVAAAFGNSQLQASAADQAPSSTSVDVSGVSNPNGGGVAGEFNGETVPGMINAALVGSFDLVYAENAPGAPFADGEAVTVVVGSDNSLSLPGGKTLFNPVYRVFGVPNDAEIIWLDADSNIEYALSNNSGGTFNEINVGDASNPQSANGIPGFLGQLRLMEVDPVGPPQELIDIAGQYTGTVVSRSGSFGGSGGAYALNDMLLVNVDSDGVITVDDQYRFDPADDSYDFINNRAAQPESFYRVETGDAENSQMFEIIFDSADGSSPVAYRLSLTERVGPGSFRRSVLEMELRPLPAALTAFFSAMNADSPVALTAISVPGGGGPAGFETCSVYTLATDEGGTVNSSNSRTPFRYELKTADTGQRRDSEIYRRSNTRFSQAGGNDRLQFQRNAILRRGDGFIDLINLDASRNEQARLTNDPDQINSACGGGDVGTGDAFDVLGGASFRFLGADYVATGPDVSWTGDTNPADAGREHNTIGNFTVNDGEFGLDQLKVMPAFVGVVQACRNTSNSPDPTFQETNLGLKLRDAAGQTYIAGVLDPDRTSCSVTVTEITETGFKGTFSAQVSRFLDSSSPVLPVTNGYFEHIDELPTGGGASASFRVGSQVPEYTQIACNQGSSGMTGLQIILGANEIVLELSDYGADALTSPSEYVTKRFRNVSDTSRYATLQAYVAAYDLRTPVYAANSSSPLISYTNTGGVQRVFGSNIPVDGRADTMDIDVTCPSD